MEMDNTIISSFLLFFQEGSGAHARLSQVITYKTYRHINVALVPQLENTDDEISNRRGKISPINLDSYEVYNSIS